MTAIDNSYRIKGGRSGVLLIHGLCGTPAEMRFVANALARQGHSVLCPQLAGHCATFDDLKSSKWQDWLESARAGLLELAKDCDTITVGGLSTGGLLALMLAAQHPELIDRVSLYSPTIWLNGSKIPLAMRIARHCLAFKAIARHFDFPSPQNYGIKDKRIREYIKAAMAKSGSAAAMVTTPGMTALQRRWLAKETLRILDRVNQPVLIIHPRDDCLADLNNAFYLQRKLPGRTELVVLDDSYHLITIDRQRHLVADATLRFLAQPLAQTPNRPRATIPAPANSENVAGAASAFA